MNTLVNLIRQYQKLIEKNQKLIGKKQALAEQIREIEHQRSDVVTELRQVKTVIDFCIETGCSPTEAKLRHTLVEMTNAIEMSRFSSYDSGYGQGHVGGSGLGSTISLNPYTTGLAVGIGATGPTYSVPYSTITNTGHIALSGVVKGATGP